MAIAILAVSSKSISISAIELLAAGKTGAETACETVSTNSEVVEDSEVPSPSLTVSFSLDIVNKWEGGTVSEFYKSQKSTKHYTAKHV